MMWQLADAKNKFSEVMTRALTEGPQRVRRRDQVVVIISETDFDQLAGKSKSFQDHLLSVPDLSDLDLSRDRSEMREVSI
jgi:prevent-host-death family protein